MPVKSNEMPDGFGTIITVSVIAHAALLIIGGIFFKDEAERRIIPRSYTVVKLVGAVQEKAAPIVTAPAPAPATPAAQQIPTPVEAPQAPEQAPDIKIPAKKQPSPAQPKETKKTAKHDATAVNTAIKKLALKAKKKEARSSVESRLDALRMKKAAAASGVQTARTARSDANKHGARGAQGAGSAKTDGNRNAGGAPQADFRGQYPAYYSIIRDKIQNKWVYPEGLSEADMLVSAHVKIGRNGALLEAKLEESSGNQLFDDSLINAIKKAAPFPPLPEEFENKTLDAVIRFCSACGD